MCVKKIEEFCPDTFWVIIMVGKGHDSMKILHYSLGFPPYRTGGLTKFCMDLMVQQIKESHSVALLWPGQMEFINKEIRIRNGGLINGIESWEIINPLPVPYDEGIKDIDKFMETGKNKCYDDFLDKVNPDVIHIHTLMGLHGSFVQAAKSKRIKMVFSTHDFFPICPKVTMFRDTQICDCIKNCEKCAQCNTTALSMFRIRLLQSSLYRYLKNTYFMKAIRKKHRDDFLSETHSNKKEKNIKLEAKKYLELRKYYFGLLDYIDIIHYNSKITKAIYEKYYRKRAAVCISLTHSDIKDNREIKKVANNELKLSYLGPYSYHKGFFMLNKALDNLWKKRQDFCLNIFFELDNKSPYIKSHSRYSYADLKNIFEKTDVLIVPSIWYETFGYTVLEAISYGVPVIITKNVGAKDIIPKGGGIIIENICAEELERTINDLTIEILQRMNKAIVEEAKIKSLAELSVEIMEQCYM